MLASHSVFELNRSSFFFILDYSCFDLFFFLVFFLAVSSHIKSTSDFYLLAFFR